MVRRAAKSQKAYLDLGSFRRAAPRAVGSRSRVGLLARPSSAGVGSGGRRRAALAACLPLLFGGCRTRQPARDPGKPVGGGDASRYVWFVVKRSELSRLVCLPRDYYCSEQCPRLLEFEHF